MPYKTRKQMIALGIPEAVLDESLKNSSKWSYYTPGGAAVVFSGGGARCAQLAFTPERRGKANRLVWDVR